MGRKANPAVIGAFVVGAITLTVIGVLVFGSGRLFKHNVKMICFFSGTVNGLNVGAPVKFKGVEVGSVSDIQLRFEEAGVVERAKVEQGVRIPVLIEVDPDKVSLQGGRRNLRDPAQVRQLIDLGMRAQLNAQSLVTGLLFIQLDFHPENPPTFYLPPGSKEIEIPTIPTPLEMVQSAVGELMHKLDEVHFDALVRTATDALDGIKNLVTSPALKQTIETLPTTVSNINDTFVALRQTVARLNEKGSPIEKMGGTLEQVQVTLKAAENALNSNSPFAVRLNTSLQEVAEAARSLRLLADYLERNPGAIIRGKEVVEK